MDSPSSTTGGRRRLPSTHYAEDQAFDQIAKEVSKIILFNSLIFIFNVGIILYIILLKYFSIKIY